MKTRSRLDNRDGYSLLELMITVGIVSFVLAGVYATYITLQKTTKSTMSTSEMQQNVRITLDNVTRLLTMAGYQGACNVKPTDPTGHAHGIIYNKVSTDNLDGDATNPATDAHSITFTYWDEDNAYIAPPGCNRERRIRIYLDSANNEVLAQTEAYYNPSPGIPPMAFKRIPSTPIVLAKEIKDITFSYFDQTGASVTPSSTNITTIRKVTATVTGQTSLKDIVLGGFKSFSLSSDIRPINIGIEGHSTTTTPPAVPKGLTLSDPHICGAVNVTWTANTEVDFDHYTLYWGAGSGQYSYSQKVSGISTTSYTISGWTNGTPIYVTISATNTSGISSATATEKSLTLAAQPPSAPVNFRASAGSSDGQIVLQWDKYSDPSLNSSVIGYRIYRKTITDTSNITPFTYPIPAPPPAGVTKLVDENSFSSLVTSTGGGYQFTDTGLTGCIMYDYTITPVTYCFNPATDYTPAQYSRVYGNGSNIGAPNVTVPTNSAKPSNPSNLLAIPGDQTNYLSWKNPGDSDFKGVAIYRSTSTFPASPTDPTATLVVDDSTDPQNATPTFPDAGLNNNTCYYYTAFAYTNCRVYSTGLQSVNASGQTTPACSKPCSNIPYGLPPGPPQNQFQMNICAQSFGISEVQMGWADASNLSSFPDVIGYNVYRYQPSDPNNDSTTPIRFYYKNPGNYNIYTDVDYPGEGLQYTYWVRTIDCSHALNSEAAPNQRVSLTAFPGKVAYDSTQPTVSLGNFHNVLQFNTENTSAHQALVTGMTLSWSGNNTETNAVLSAIYEGTGTSRQLVWSGSVSPNAQVSVTSPNSSTGVVLDQATGPGAPFSATFQFVWTKSDGTTDSTVDMHAATVTIQYNYNLYYFNSFSNQYVPTNQSLGNCTPVTYTVTPPYGPVVTSVTQSQPTAGTFSLTDPGLVVVPPSALTDVSAFVTDTSENLKGIQSVQLYYAFTNMTSTKPPTVGSVPDNINTYSNTNPTGFTPMTTIPTGTGDYVQYLTTHAGKGHPIPASNNYRAWYFMLAQDKNGNFSRWPAPKTPDINYSYDQLQGLGGGGGGGGSSGTVTASIETPGLSASVYGITTIAVSATTTSGTISGVQVQVGSGGWTTCILQASGTYAGYYTCSWDTTQATNGPITVTASATATTGSTGTDSRSVTVSNPTVAITSPTGGATVSGMMLPMTGTSSGGAAGTITGVKVSTDGGLTYSPVLLFFPDTGNWNYNWDTTTVANGTYTLYAQVTAGTVTITSSPVTVTVSNAVVVNVSVASPAANATVAGTSVPIYVSASSNGTGISNVQASVSTGGTTVYSSPCSPVMSGPYAGYWTCNWDTTSLAYGQYAITATATDGVAPAPTTTATSQAVTVTVDNTEITLSFHYPTSGSTVSGTITVQVSASVNAKGASISSVQMNIDGGAWATMNLHAGYYEYSWDTSKWNTTALLYGTHKIYVQATGGSVTKTISEDVTVDNGSVTVSFVTPTAGTTVSGSSVLVQAQVTSSGAGITTPPTVTISGSTNNMALNGNGYWQYAWDTRSITYNSSVTITVSATVGTHSGTANETVAVDNGVVTVSYYAPGAGTAVSGTSVALAGSVSSTGKPIGSSGVQVSLDGGSTWVTAGNNGSSWSYTWNSKTAGYGPHTFEVKATDGYVNSSVVSWSVNVDNTTLTTSFNAPIAGSTVNGKDVLVQVQATSVEGTTTGAGAAIDPNTGVQVTINGQTYYAPYNSGTGYYEYHWDSTNIGNQSTTITAKATATGYAGTHTSNTASDTVNVNNGTVTVKITAPTAGTTQSSPPSVTVKVSASSTGGMLDGSHGSVTITCNGVSLTPVNYVHVGGTTYDWEATWDTSGIAYNSAVTITATATDSLNQTNTDSISVPVDNSVITPGAISVSPSQTVNGVATVSGTAVTASGTATTNGAAVTGVQVSVNGGSYVSATTFDILTGAWSYTWDTTGITYNSSVTIAAKATDGYVTSAAVSKAVAVDNGVVTVTITSPAPNGTISGTVTTTGTASSTGAAINAGTGVQVSADGTNWYNASYNSSNKTWSFSSWNTTGITYNPSLIIYAKATDGYAAATASETITVDNSTLSPGTISLSPTGTNILTGAVTVSGTSVTVSGTATTNGAAVTGVNVSVNGGSYVPATTFNILTGAWSYTWDTTGITYNTSVTIAAKATDGYVTSAAVNKTVAVDNSALAVSITNPAAAPTKITGNPITVSGSATSTGATLTASDIQVQIDNGGYNPATTISYNSGTKTYSWTYTWNNPTFGSHTIYAYVWDGYATTVLNPGAVSEAVSVDNTTVSVAIGAGTPTAGSTVSGTSVTVAGTASSSDSNNNWVSQVQVSTDNGSTWNTASGTTNWSYTWDTTKTTNGSATIQARAYAANSDASPAPNPTRTVTVSNAVWVNASISNPNPPSGTVLSGTQTIAVSASTNGTGMVVQTKIGSGGAWQTCTYQSSGGYAGYYTYSWDTTTAPYGANTFYVQATANSVTASANKSVNVDNTTTVTASFITPTSSTGTVSGTYKVQVFAQSNTGGAPISGIQLTITPTNPSGSAGTYTMTYDGSKYYYYNWVTSNGTFTLSAIATATSTGMPIHTSSPASISVNAVAVAPTISVPQLVYKDNSTPSKSVTVSPDTSTTYQAKKNTTATWTISATDANGGPGIKSVTVTDNQANSGSPIDITSGHTGTGTFTYTYAPTLPNGIYTDTFYFTVTDKNGNWVQTGVYTIQTN